MPQIMPSFARPLISGTPTPSSSISTELSPARRRINRADSHWRTPTTQTANMIGYLNLILESDSSKKKISQSLDGYGWIETNSDHMVSETWTVILLMFLLKVKKNKRFQRFKKNYRIYLHTIIHTTTFRGQTNFSPEPLQINLHLMFGRALHSKL